MSEPLPKPWTVEDFLAWERTQPERYEFIDGVVRTMGGGTAAHTAIKGNVFAALLVRLRGKSCRPFAEGLKVATPTAMLYPDAIVVCTPVDPQDDHVREPVVVVEVLSESTAERDHGFKRWAYRTIPLLLHYVLIAQDEPLVEVASPDPDGAWRSVLLARARRHAAPGGAERRDRPR